MLIIQKNKIIGALLGIALLITFTVASPSPLTPNNTAYALTLSEANQAASDASEAYDEAVANQEAIAAEIAELEKEIAETEALLAEERSSLETVIVSTYKNGTIMDRVATVLASGQFSLPELLTTIANLFTISEWQSDTVSAVESTLATLEEQQTALEEKKAEADEAVEEALAAKEEALDAQEEARAAAAAASASSSSVSSTRSSSSYSSGSEDTDEEAARLWIINKESGGNYSAVSASGKYYGAYQLTRSYLNGDYSVENQDATAQAYVESRYGSWTAAVAFWKSHGWY